MGVSLITTGWTSDHARTNDTDRLTVEEKIRWDIGLDLDAALGRA